MPYQGNAFDDDAARRIAHAVRRVEALPAGNPRPLRPASAQVRPDPVQVLRVTSATPTSSLYPAKVEQYDSVANPGVKDLADAWAFDAAGGALATGYYVGRRLSVKDSDGKPIFGVVPPPSSGSGSKVLAVGTVGTFFTNTTTGTSLFGAATYGSKTTAAGFWSAGKAVRFSAYLAGTLSSGNFTLSIQDTANGVVYFATSVSGTTSLAMRVDALLVATSTTNVSIGITYWIDGDTASVTTSRTLAVSTNAQTLDLFGVFSVASNANQAVQQMAMIEALN